jgi:hypothetical protein
MMSWSGEAAEWIIEWDVEWNSQNRNRQVKTAKFRVGCFRIGGSADLKYIVQADDSMIKTSAELRSSRRTKTANPKTANSKIFKNSQNLKWKPLNLKLPNLFVQSLKQLWTSVWLQWCLMIIYWRFVHETAQYSKQD